MNYELKNPRKYYMWSIKSGCKCRRIMFTINLNPKPIDFYHQIGQFIESPIKEMKLIGYKLVKDHYGNDTEEIFENTITYMLQKNTDNHNKKFNQ